MPIMASEVHPLLEQGSQSGSVAGCVNYKNHPASRSATGGWASASFVIGMEMGERFAYYGIASNLITFLTGPLGQSVATAAANVNAWAGTSMIFPLLGAFFADFWLGRYRTILYASLLYILGLGLLSLSAELLYLHISNADILIYLFFFALYLVAFAQGGVKPCVQAFGADQFDVKDPKENVAKQSFFNWWYFCISLSSLLFINLLTYIQDNINWVIGFGIPCIAMICALILFILGKRTYRFSTEMEKMNAYVRIYTVFVMAFKNWRTDETKPLHDGKLLSNQHSGCGRECGPTEDEEVKSVLRLLPIWLTCIIYALVFSQSSTFFTKQGLTLNRNIVSGFQLPPACLQSFISMGIVIFIPIYDRVFVPLTRRLTKQPSGITTLQRIGIGMVLSFVSMTIAALVEMKRLRTAKDYGLVDLPNATLPMSIWCLIPQYFLFGISDVFTMVGLQEFFYDQVPHNLRSVGLSLYLGIFGVGSFLSTFLITAIQTTTSRDGQDGWFANNLNRAHLDYFYWLLAGLSAVQFLVFLLLSKYVYLR